MHEFTYATDLRCGKCEAKIKPILDAEKEIDHWSVDLSHPAKLLEVSLTRDDRELVPGLLGKAGYNAELKVVLGSDKSDDGVAFDLAKYRPLFLVVTYIVSLTALIEWQSGTLVWTRAMSNFMGFFFLGFAFFKLLNVVAFADAFASYDLVARRSRVYGLSYPFIELGLGLLFVLGLFPLWTNLATFLIMSIGLVGVTKAVLARQQIQCACLGTGFNLPMSFVTIVENSVMILMALGMLASLASQ